jgi:DTW domain-containing protein YfiP
MSRRGDGLGRPRATCYRCFKPQVACICDSVARVANRTGIIILQHPRERFHPVGTARIAALGFEKVRLELCAPWADAALLRDRVPLGTALLYPSPGASELAALSRDDRPRHLVVLDGTWSQAKKIYDVHSWLRALPHVRLTPSEPSCYRIRRQPRPECVATLEAILQALAILEPQTQGLDRLSASFRAMIDRQAAYVAEGVRRVA